MTVGQAQAGDAAAREAAGVGGLRIGFEEERHDRLIPPAGLGHARKHARQVWPIKQVTRWLAGGREGAALARAAREAGERHRSVDLPGRSRGGVLEGRRHEATVDEDELSLGCLERGIDVQARPQALVEGEHMALARMQKLAVQAHVEVFDIAAVAPSLQRFGERYGGSMDTRLDPGDQAFLPRLAAHLPVAEPDEHGKAGESERARPKQLGLAPASEGGLQSGGASRPSSALCLNCKAIRVALSTRRRKKATSGVSRPQRIACTTTGGPTLNSRSNAPPSTTKPRMRMPNTAGPSPESANAKLRPQRSQVSRSTRPLRKRPPPPQRGQRALRPAASTEV